METRVPVQFDIYEGDQLVRTEILSEQTIKIGKLSSSHLRIDDDEVSRMHAVVEVNGPDDVVVLDLGSATGTYVNGTKVTKQRLRSGDTLQLGRTRVVVSISGQSARFDDPRAAGTQVSLTKAPARPTTPNFEDDEAESDGSRALEVIAMWGPNVLQVDHFSTSGGTYTVGETEAVTHFLRASLLPEDPYTLARTDGAEMTVNVPEGVSGEVMLDGQVYAIDELKSAGKLSKSHSAQRSSTLRLPPRARCRLQIGELTFLVNSVGGARPLPKPSLFAQFDGHFGRYFIAAAILHVIFGAIVLSIPEDEKRLSLDGFNLNDRWVEFILKPETEKEEKLDDLFKDLKDEGEMAAKAKEDEGQLGKKDSPEKNQRFAVKGPVDQKELLLAKERAKTEALNVANAAFNQLDNELAAVWAENDRAIGSDAVSALGNMFGDRVGEANGFGGLGVAGVGRGGGGFSENSVGVGNVNTAGRGGGGDGGSGYGRGVTRYGDKAGKVPQVIPGKPIISGALDMETIRRIIRQHQAEYRYCYEKQLNVKRDLQGKVVVKFTISGTGNVIAAAVEETSMNDSAVESCLKGKIMRWVFPEPKGGGIVIVKYPFVFKAS